MCVCVCLCVLANRWVRKIHKDATEPIDGWLVIWVLGHINLCRLFNAKSIFVKNVRFQTIQFGINTQFKCKYSLIVKTFLFQTILFSQAVLIQLIHLVLVQILLNVKTVLY